MGRMRREHRKALTSPNIEPSAASLNVTATAAAGEPRQPVASLPLRFSNQTSTKGAEETPNRDYSLMASKDRLTVVHRGLCATSQ
ncbi:hypothetical protein V6N13_068401 [Hibiscus sabdariffa]|uniref:Uncharacterized protein n=1 Tax=Hibiscus sabdariffa TaxID=183260 RepID=A0ABR2QMH6_9ROSI